MNPNPTLEAPPAQPTPRNAPAAVLLLVLSLAAFAPALTGGLLWCDDYTVAENAALQDLEGLGRIWRGGVTEQYYPLTYTLYFVVVQLVGPEPVVLHTLCILLHASCALLLLGLCRHLLAPGPALLGAALFAVHPLAVESVGWIYELKNPWSTLWLLLSLRAWFADRDGSGPRAYLGSLGFFLLALLAKTAVLVMPLWLIGLAVIRDRAGVGRRWLPLLVLAVGFAALTLAYEAEVTGATGAEWQAGIAERLCVAGRVFWFYLGRMLMPWDLAFAYGRFEVDPARLVGWLPLLAWVAVGALLVLLRQRWWGRGALTWFGLYSITVLPVSGLFDIYMHRYTHVADHLAYLPWMLTTPFLAGFLANLTRAIPGTWRTFLAGLVVVSLAGLTIQRASLFRPGEGLWRESLQRDDGVWLAHLQLGLLARSRGDQAEAERRFERALQLQETADAHLNLGNVLVDQGRVAEALTFLRRAQELGALDPGSRHSLATALASSGQVDAALAQYDVLLAEDRHDALAAHNRERLGRLAGQLDTEAARLRGILTQRPQDAAAWRRLAETCLARGRHTEARDAFARWVELEPGAAEGWQSLTWIQALGPDPAVRDADRAMRAAARLQELRGDQDPRALEVIAAAHAAAGRTEQATRLVARAVRLARTVRALEGLVPRLEAAERRYAAGRPPP